MNESLEVKGNALNDQLNELKSENSKLKSMCMHYESILKDINQNFWTWDVVNNVYNITTPVEGSFSYMFDHKNITIEAWEKAIHPEDVNQALKTLQTVLDFNFDHYENVFRIQRRNGTYSWIHSKGKTEKDHLGNVIRIKGTHIDITEKLDLEKKLFNIAYFDSLTKLPNKEKLYNDYNSLIETQSTFPSGGLTFLFMDIDNFGYINSLLGYDEGNNIIKKFSEFLVDMFPNEMVSRVSADEFIVIHRHYGEISDFEQKIETFQKCIRNTNFVKGHDIKITVSIGISFYEIHGVDFYELLKNADVALYCAKKKGKDRFEFYHQHMELSVFNNVDSINQIRVGLLKNEFQMYYHPIIDNHTDLLVGIEGLIRWKHTQRGFIPPDKFIPIAEDSGVMPMLEEWLIEEVFKQVEKWVEKGDLPLFASINLSSKGLIERNLIDFLDIMLQKYKVTAQKIKFEVTETAMLKDINQSIAMLNQLVGKGFEISLDDFGTGYSSLNYLKNLPINNVKLDKSFIDCVVENEKDKYLVRSIIDLSHSFRLKVIAEGVESKEQLDLLKNMKCDYIQGYYYGKPMSVSDTEEWIRNNYIEKMMQLNQQ